jgi:predicted nucleic acid-binding protein
MSKMKLLFASGIASAFVFLCSGFGPVVAFADEAVEGVETSEIVSVEEVIENEESVENTANDEVVEETTKETEIDFDDLLAFVGDLAEKEGFKDEWDKAMYYVETAASEKKVEVMIGLSIAVIVLFVTDRIVKIINYLKAKKYDTSKKDLKDILSSSGAQTDAINGLIDETANVGECAKSTETREKKIAEATKKQNTALRCLIRGTNIKQDLKDEALRNLNESDDLCDDAKK